MVLALANATAYWGVVIDPVVIAFAVLAWQPHMRSQHSVSCAAWLTAAWALFFSLFMTFSHSWLAFFSTDFAANASGQSISPALGQIWINSGLIICLALIGGLITLHSDRRKYAVVLVAALFAAYMLAQLRDQTASSVDNRLAYGIWFAVIPAGYACSKFIRSLPRAGRQLAALCCVVVLAYPAGASWQSAWERYHSWPNAAAFIAAFKPIATESAGLIYVPGQEINIAEYYTPASRNWTQWTGPCIKPCRCTAGYFDFLLPGTVA